MHKQTAICFKAPRYRTLDITEPVKVSIQLRRPSDGMTSEPLAFELLPLDSGRPLYWSFRRNYAKKNNYNNLFSTLLAADNKAKKPTTEEGDNNMIDTTNINENIVVSSSSTETNNNEVSSENNNNITVATDYSIVDKMTKLDNKTINNEEKSFNEIISQVAELDEIYSENQARLLNEVLKDVDQSASYEIFDDAKTYSSLQLAFKNPVQITHTDLNMIAPQSALVDANRSKREIDLEKPPLPPKRSKKIETFIGNSTQSVNEIGLSRAHSIHLLPRPKSQEPTFPSKLPPIPSSTLPNVKKRGLFSKLFGKKSKTPVTTSRASSVTPSVHSVTGSVASMRVELKENALPDSSTNEMDQENLGFDLTEAEHYALYTTMAPHATQSEFDETSCYYAPVEGGKILTNTEMLARLASKT